MSENFGHRPLRHRRGWSTRATTAVAAALAIALAAGVAWSQPARDDRTGGAAPMPPPEALAACKGKKARDVCSITTPKATLSGLCLTPPGRALACIPKDRPPPGPPPGAPPGPARS